MKKTILLLFLMFCFGENAFAVEVSTSTDLSPILGSSCNESSCEVEPGFGVLKTIAGGIIKYATYIVGLCAVLFIVVNGVLYSMSGLNDGLKSSAKDRIGKMLLGIVVLMLSGTILVILAPWIYKG